MNSFKINQGILSLLLMLPALFLSAAGFLYLAFGMQGANKLLEVCLSNPAGKVLLSPLVVLGGPILVAILNARKILHLSADIVNEEFVIALSVKRLLGNLLFLVASGVLIALLLTYAFVENFTIVAR